MGLTTEEMLEIVLKNISSKEKEQSIVYWDKKILEIGDDVRIGKKTIKMLFKGYMVFVDLVPKANLGHPSLYFLIDDKTHDAKVIKDEFPPYFGDYPQSFKVIQRYGKKPPHDRYFNIFDETNKKEA
jgi:hypothetical protein